MSHYGMLFPEFWGGETGRRIAAEGGAKAQVLALYLTANRSATMIGLYPAPLPVIQADIRSLSTNDIATSFGVLQEAGFARYDEPTEVVWVIEMAKFRLGLHGGATLKADDNRSKSAQKLYERCQPNPFLGVFHERYRKVLHLGKRRRFEGAWKPLLVSLTKGTASPFEAPSKPVTGSGTVTEAGSENREIVQEDPGASRVTDILGHLQSAGHAYIEAHPGVSDPEVIEELKCVAAKCRVPYDGGEIRAVVDQLRAIRKRKGFEHVDQITAFLGTGKKAVSA